MDFENFSGMRLACLRRVGVRGKGDDEMCRSPEPGDEARLLHFLAPHYPAVNASRCSILSYREEVGIRIRTRRPVFRTVGSTRRLPRGIAGWKFSATLSLRSYKAAASFSRDISRTESLMGAHASNALWDVTGHMEDTRLGLENEHCARKIVHAKSLTRIGH